MPSGTPRPGGTAAFLGQIGGSGLRRHEIKCTCRQIASKHHGWGPAGHEQELIVDDEGGPAEITPLDPVPRHFPEVREPAIEQSHHAGQWSRAIGGTSVGDDEPVRAEPDQPAAPEVSDRQTRRKDSSDTGRVEAMDRSSASSTST